MNNKEYKKTYKPFIAWLVGFLLISVIIPMFLDLSSKMSILTLLLIMVIALYILMLIIYRGEYVYWINGGPSYKEAKSGGSEKRKKYAKAHLDLFLKMTLICFIYALISIIFNLHTWIDILVISLTTIVTAFLTVSIKFEK